MTAQPVEPVDTGALDDLSLTLNELASAVTRLSDDVPAALDVDDSTEAVVRLLADLREQRKALAEMEAYVEAAAVKRIPYGQTRIGDWIVDVKGGKDRREWKHDDLAWAVVRDVAVDKDTGEVVEEARQIVDEVRSRLLNCIGISYWRTTQLKPLGIDADDYSTSTPGRRTVRLIDALAGDEAPEVAS